MNSTLLRWLKIASLSGGILLLLPPAIEVLSIDIEAHQAYQTAIVRQQFQRAALNENIIKARYQALSSYDPIVSTLRSLKVNQEKLNYIPAFIDREGTREIQEILDRKKTLLAKEEELIERFKSKNSLLKNSLRYLPELKAELVDRVSFQESDRALVKILDRLLQNILLYNLTSDLEIARTIEADLNNLKKLKKQSNLEAFDPLINLIISHIQIILKSQPEVNRLTQLAIELSDNAISEQLELNYKKYHQEAVEKINLYRLFAYFSSLLILCTIAYSIVKNISQKNREIAQVNASLNTTLKTLKTAKMQLIQTEKISGLGQMVAGVAHEINNPISFIYSNVEPARDYIQNLLQLIEAYQTEYPSPPDRLQEIIEEIDLDFILEDLPKLLKSMQIGADRIRKIVLSLRNFARLDESEIKAVNIHEGLDSTLTIVRHRLTDRTGRFAIEVIKNYGDLPLVTCSPSQMNQVFLNIINNAIEALYQRYFKEKDGDLEIDVRSLQTNTVGKIAIATQVEKSQVSGEVDRVSIDITDNGAGITEEIQSRIFDPFFSTKPIGRGTGLGLFVGYQIIVEKHGGTLECTSQLGKGTTFRIEIPLSPPNER